MPQLDELFSEMDFEFLGTGQHAMSIEGAQKVLHDDHFLFLDVRTEEEMQYLRFPFARHIPLHELPLRYDELPGDTCLVVFCSSIVRAAFAYIFLRARGFDAVKVLTAGTDDLAGIFKPGSVRNMHERMS